MATASDISTRTTVVGVFDNQSYAQDAIRELKSMGFTDSEIGVVARNDRGDVDANLPDVNESASADMAATGAATGAGIGALLALGIAANVLPAIGPAIAGGILGSILSSAAAGAAAVGLGAALVGLGVPEDEADYYQGEVKSGRTLVTVKAGSRSQDVYATLQRHGAYDMTTKDTYQTSDLYRAKLSMDPTRKPR